MARRHASCGAWLVAAVEDAAFVEGFLFTDFMTDEPHAGIDPETRRAAIIHDLATRLRPVCADWPAELFKSMIEGLADVTMKYEGSASPSSYDRRTTDRLVADLRAALEKSEEARDERPDSE